MKTALKIQILKNKKLIKEKIICPYCESGQIYPLKKKEGIIYCRICGKESLKPK